MPNRQPRPASRARIARAACLGAFALALGACAGAPGEKVASAPQATPPAAVQPAVQAQAADRPVHGPVHRKVTLPASAPRRSAGRQQVAAVAPTPRIVSPKRRLQCVPYAREHSRIEIRGDAWTWWDKARGRYQRGQVPAVGSVLVLKRRGKSRGHLAVVSRIVSDREIITHHANWLNKGQIHLETPVRDVSPNNDWSQVRVWYTPGKVLGKSTYPAYGFIYPRVQTAAR